MTAPGLARELLTLELELACLHGDARLRESFATERLHNDVLPELCSKWDGVGIIGPVQILEMRHQVERALMEWLQTNEEAETALERPEKGVLARIWHCILRWVSV